MGYGQSLKSLLGWALGGLVYFKAALDTLASYPLSVVAAAILVLALVWMIPQANTLYSKKSNAEISVSGARPMLSLLLRRTLATFLGLVACFILLCWLIVFGFSKELSRRLEVIDYRGFLNEDFVIFAFMVTAPIGLHWVAWAFHARNVGPVDAQPEN